MPESPPPSPSKPPDHQWRQASLALSVPTVMAAGPLLGILVGWALVRWLDPPPPWDWRLKAVALLICTLAGLRETIKLIKRISSHSK